MKKLTILFAGIAGIVAIAGCGGRNAGESAGEDMVDYGRIGYADIVSFICQGYQCRWDTMKPEDQGLSPVYSYSSEYAGFAEKDINGDGIPELVIGDQFEDGTYRIYDIYTINPDDGSLIHLASGGERDTFVINGSGVIIEEGSSSAFDSFQRGFTIEDGALVKLRSGDAGWEDSLMIIDFDNFSRLAAASSASGETGGLVGAFGEQREISEEEMAMFRKATADDGLVVYSPLSVSTQVVAGTNYKFWCRYEDISGQAGSEAKAVGAGAEQGHGRSASGHCWLTIFKPLPGRGEPSVTSVDWQ